MFLEDQLIIAKGMATTVIKTNGEQLFSHSIPMFSFDFDELFFRQSEKMRILNGSSFLLTDAEIEEVRGYLATVQEDSALTARLISNNVNMAYLEKTDWYVLRFIETGIPVPPDISAARAQARLGVENTFDLN